MRAQRLHQRSRRLAAVMAVVCVGVGAGCARSRPATTPVPIALNVPPPPPRVIATPPEPVAPTEATNVERPAPVNRPSRSARGASRPEPRTEPVRPETAPETTPPAAAPEATAPAGPLLRTPQTADEREAENRTTEVLRRASEHLKKVNPATLAPAARQQYETAQRFVEQAEHAMLQRNYVLASYLADKAETLAKGISR